MTDWIAKLDELNEAERRLIMKIAKGWLDKGENPTIVLSHVKKWIDKNNGDDDGVDSRQGHKDPTQELEDLVDERVAARGISRSKAYDEVLSSRPDVNVALASARDKRLRKAAQAAGGNHGAI